MNRWIRLGVAATLILATSTTVRAGGQGRDVDQQIKEAMNQYYAAMLKPDTTTIENLLADDYIGIHSDGTVNTKAQEMDSFRSGTLKYETHELRDMKIRVYGDAAVVTAALSVKGTIMGKPFSGAVRITRVWVERNGGWKCVVFQATRSS